MQTADYAGKCGYLILNALVKKTLGFFDLPVLFIE